jgi:hypothetical protein
VKDPPHPYPKTRHGQDGDATSENTSYRMFGE